jgi:hypothetical protein
MEALLILFVIGFGICFFIRHPLKSLKYIFYTLTFLALGYIVVIMLFFYLMSGANT